MSQNQTAAQAAGPATQNAARAEQLAQSTIDAAEQALQQARATGVTVKPLDNRILITMPSSDGTRRSMELSSDGKSLLSIDGIATTAIAPRARTSRNGALPEGAIGLMITLSSLVAVVAIFGPVARAIARRIDRRTGSPALTSDTSQRLAAIERAVDAVAVEVERISEGQRFTTKLLAERANSEAEVR